MEETGSRISTRMMILGGILAFALASAAIFIPIYIGNVRDSAYEKGAYDHAYKIFVEEWDDSRANLVHASLAASVCTHHSDAEQFCGLLQTSRSLLQQRDKMPRISDGSNADYRRAVLQAESEVRQLDAAEQRLNRLTGYLEGASTSEEIWQTIDLTADLVPDALEALDKAEQAIADGTADSSVVEAKEELEAVLARYEAQEFPTAWDIEDLHDAHNELLTAVDNLKAAL